MFRRVDHDLAHRCEGESLLDFFVAPESGEIAALLDDPQPATEADR